MRVLKKDLCRRKKYNKQEVGYYILKALKKNECLDKSIGYSIQKRLEMNKNLLVKVQNRCLVTGRKHGIVKKLKKTRMEVKRILDLQMLEGLKKIVW